MKVAVYDTYVTRKDGAAMHFDILVSDDLKDKNRIHRFGKAYLNEKGQEGQQLSSRECKFCHVEQATDQMLPQSILKGIISLKWKAVIIS